MKKPLTFILILIFLFSFTPTSFSQPKPESNGNISFMPNVIPDLTLTPRTGRNNESFRLEWYNNTLDLELFFNATYNNVSRLFGLKDFEDDFNVTVAYEVDRNESNIQFGWVIDNIENVSNFVDSAWFKIEDSSFDYEDIIIEENMDTLMDFGYNITYYHLPDRLRLSFADLNDKGFIIGNQNKTATSVKGFSGKSSWNLDPIVESGGIITITGYSTEGTAADHDDIYTAIANTTISNKQDVKQYSFGYARIVVGDGENTTWFVDTSAQVSFNTSCFTANSQNTYEVKANSYLRFGTLIDDATKRTSAGLSVMVRSGSYNYISAIRGTELQLYSSLFEVDTIGTKQKNIVGANVVIYNSILNGLGLGSIGTNGEIYNVLIYGARYGTWAVQCPIEKLFVFNCWGSAIGAYYLDSVNAKNVDGKNNAKFFYASSLSADSYIINSEFDSWAITWVGSNFGGKIYRQYEFDLNVTDSANSPIQNANVTVSHYGEGDGQDFSILTGSNGSFTTQTLTMGFYNQTGANILYDYNDYNITITHTSYATKTFNFTLQEQIDWQIALDPPSTSTVSFNSTYYLLGAITFMPLLLIGLVLRRKRIGRRV